MLQKFFEGGDSVEYYMQLSIDDFHDALEDMEWLAQEIKSGGK